MWQLPASRWLTSMVKPTSGYYLQILTSWYYLHIFFRRLLLRALTSWCYLHVSLATYLFSVLSSGISQYYLQVLTSRCYLHVSLATYLFSVLSSGISQYYLQVFIRTIFRYLLLGAIFMYLWALTFPQYCLQVLTFWQCPCSFLLLLLSSAQFSYGLYRIFGLSRADLPLPSPLSAGFVSAGVSLDLRAVQQLQAQFVPGQGEGHRHPQAVEEDAQKGTAQWVVKQVVSAKRWGDKCDEIGRGG